MNAGLWQRLALVVVPAAVAMCGCIGDDTAVVMTATATIEDDAAADGCSIVVTIDGTDYAPDGPSFSAIRDRHLPVGVPVTISYRLTGNTGRAQCGFGSHRDLPEIALVFDE